MKIQQSKKLLNLIFGERILTIDEKIDRIIDESGIDKDIEGVHFTKVLQNHVKNIKK